MEGKGAASSPGASEISALAALFDADSVTGQALRSWRRSCAECPILDFNLHFQEGGEVEALIGVSDIPPRLRILQNAFRVSSSADLKISRETGLDKPWIVLGSPFGSGDAIDLFWSFPRGRLVLSSRPGG